MAKQDPAATELRQRIDARLDEMIADFYRTAPVARYLASSDDIRPDLFRRHTIETILRIRLARIADSKAIDQLARTDPRAAQVWAQYAADEMLHDKLFLKDLRKLGVEESEVYGTEPFLATKLLQGYLYYTLEHEGPMGLLTKAYFLEYTTLKTQGEWNDNIERTLGPDSVNGARGHLNIDANDAHTDDVWDALYALVDSAEAEARLWTHLETYFVLFHRYFEDLGRMLASEGTEQTSAQA
ncbi:iron-containing redox enzyme family protein [Haliangium ochraceum]|uniref:Transcriptional activator, TenA family n=1 Tax=Haliangium ochraceum (strain DSM 14365 / JCM 11303 / SMP-2) TaxID=502025 RepID=D0LMS2_HALO1|nr:iron-containing redox enzyme family protein [Haliangium ochraceum]ACY18759.1 conserved hypothetical protein [Haliangium ochraceum DSM 14365]